MITTYITYDNFTFTEPVPFVSKNQEIINYGDRWGQITKITLEGQLTGAGGCPDDFASLINGQNNLISGFSRDFKKLSIIEDSKTLFEADACIIRNINFEQSRYVKMLGYTIELDCYERDLFSGVYGVLDPVNEYTFTENEDQSVAISHNISARGINTSTNSAIENARNYVYSLTGYDPNILPININNSNYTPLLRSYVENINRLNGTYNIQENYIVDNSNNAYINPLYFTRYTTSINKSINSDFDSMSIQGSVQGDKRANFSGIRYYASGLNLYSICSGLFGSQLNPIPISLSFDENSEAKTINFSAAFDTCIIIDTEQNIFSDNDYFDGNAEITKDMINSLTSITISGPIIVRRGNLKEKYEKSVDYINNIINIYGSVPTYLYDRAYESYNKLKSIMNIPSNITLNPYFRSYNITENPEKGEITISATFDDKDAPPNVSYTKLNNFEISYQPKIDLFKPRPTYNINGFYIIYELNNAKKLATVNINSSQEFIKNTLTANAKTDFYKTLENIRNIYISGDYVLMNETTNFDETRLNETKNASTSLEYSKQNSAKDTSSPFLPAKIYIKQ